MNTCALLKTQLVEEPISLGMSYILRIGYLCAIKTEKSNHHNTDFYTFVPRMIYTNFRRKNKRFDDSQLVKTE